MESVFSYIIGLGAAVMMPVIFTILGVCIGIKFSKALKSGLYVGVGFVGLSVITALLTSSLGPALSKVVEIYGLELQVFDMGWPAAASVAYNTLVGSFIIPVCLGVNLVLLLLGCTRTVNIDLWNYWHFAFIGAVVYFMTESVLWGFFAAIVCYIITLVLADLTAKRFQKFYPNMEGISIPQPFCQGFMPFAVAINKGLDYVPGINKVNIDSEGMKKKFGEDKELYSGMAPALVIGHPTTLVVSLLLIPVTLVLAVVLPGNQFLPLASLAGMFYVFVMVLPYTNGNVLRSFIVGLVVMALGLYFVTWMAGDFTSAAHSVALAHPEDASVAVPSGFQAGALDFASSPLSTLIYACCKYLQYIGAAALTLLALALVVWNRRRIKSGK